MTCKNCIHYKLCEYSSFEEYRSEEALKNDCKDFINKDRIIETKKTHEQCDICIYQYDNDNKSLAIVEIVKIISDEAAEIRFIKVIVDDTGNGFFNYLFETGKTMNASLKYLKNIIPCC